MGALVYYSNFLGFGFRTHCRTLCLLHDARVHPTRRNRRAFPPLVCCARFDHSHSHSGPDFKPPQDAVLEVLSEAAKAEGRVSQTTNLVMGGTVVGTSDDEWKALNEKVNSYPTSVNFTAIGSGGDDFVQAMVGAVESVLQCSILEDDVKLSLSSKGRYISVRIGPVEVDSSEQVQAVYKAMKRDVRMRYFL